MQSVFEELLHYGLILGAIIQLVAIASIFLLNSPQSKFEGREENECQPGGVPNSTIDKPKKTVFKGSRKRKKITLS